MPIAHYKVNLQYNVRPLLVVFLFQLHPPHLSFVPHVFSHYYIIILWRHQVIIHYFAWRHFFIAAACSFWAYFTHPALSLEMGIINYTIYCQTARRVIVPWKITAVGQPSFTFRHLFDAVASEVPVERRKSTRKIRQLSTVWRLCCCR